MIVLVLGQALCSAVGILLMKRGRRFTIVILRGRSWHIRSSHWHSATTCEYQGLPAVTTAQKADSLKSLP